MSSLLADHRHGRLTCFQCGWTIADWPTGRGGLYLHLKREHGVPGEELPEFGDEIVFGGRK